MPAYSQTTLGSALGQLGVILDDQNELYWSHKEKTYAIQEFLRVFGALTAYWRTRGTFNITAQGSSLWSSTTFPWSPTVFPWQFTSGYPWYDLSVTLPTLRTRTWTLNQMTQEIQYACLEAADGIDGAGMSGQISVASILQAIQRARNRFVLDAHLPLSIHANFSSTPPQQGMVQFAQSSAFVHRVGWQDIPSGAWTNLWREDAWSVDKNNQMWTIEPGSPLQYSEAENAPLALQMSPPPLNSGVMEALTVDSLQMDLTSRTQTFNVPDEWVHAIKYAALSDLFSAESQNTDPLRAQYAEMRYQQSIAMAKDARSIIRLMANGIPLPIDSMASIDAGNPYWRNQSGSPFTAGVLYDLLAFSPGIADTTYSISADVVQSAPLPILDGDYIQIGYEDLDNLFDYCTHILTFKCGGNEFKGTFPGYDSFMQSVGDRKGINAAKIRYLRPLFGQPQVEQAQRPDQVRVA